MTPDPTVTAVSDERLQFIAYANKASGADLPSLGEAVDMARELLRARSALADVGECELCNGTGNAVVDYCADCNGTGKQPRPSTVALADVGECSSFIEYLRMLIQQYPSAQSLGGTYLTVLLAEKIQLLEDKQPRPAAEVGPAVEMCKDVAAQLAGMPSESLADWLDDFVRGECMFRSDEKPVAFAEIAKRLRSPAAHTAQCPTCIDGMAIVAYGRNSADFTLDRVPCPTCSDALRAKLRTAVAALELAAATIGCACACQRCKTASDRVHEALDAISLASTAERE